MRGNLNDQTEVHGLQLIWDSVEQKLIGYIEDSKETEWPPKNSVKAVWNVGKYVNLADGYSHSIFWGWSHQPLFVENGYLAPTAQQSWSGRFGTFGNANNYFGYYSTSAYLDYAQYSYLVVDNILIPADHEWSKKTTPLEFEYEAGKSTYVAIGAQTTQVGSYASPTGNAENGFNGTIRAAGYWGFPIHMLAYNDGVYGFINETYQFQKFFKYELERIQAKKDEAGEKYYREIPETLTGTPSIGLQTFLTYLDNWESYTPSTTYVTICDAVSGTQDWAEGLSSSLVAYYKFYTENAGSLTAKDWSGTAYGGANRLPGTGNTMHFFGPYMYDIEWYDISDVEDSRLSSTDKMGYLMFENEAGSEIRIGTINYDLGICVFDNQYTYDIPTSLTGLPMINSIPVSGMSVLASASSSNIWVKSIGFNCEEDIERVSINLNAIGPEMNFTQNPTGIEKSTGSQLLGDDEPAGFVTSVGLYNEKNELVAIGKLNKPIRKDEDHNTNFQVRLDF